MSAGLRKGRRYVQTDHELIHGRAVKLIAADLGRRFDRHSVLGRLALFYDHCWEHAPDGFIDGPLDTAIAEIEEVMDWDRGRHGKGGILFKSMVQHGLLTLASGPQCLPCALSDDPPPDCASCAPLARPSGTQGARVMGWMERYGEALKDRIVARDKKRRQRDGRSVVASNLAERLDKPKSRPRDSLRDGPPVGPEDGPRDGPTSVPGTVHPIPRGTASRSRSRGVVGEDEPVTRKPAVRVKGHRSGYDAVVGEENEEFLFPIGRVAPTVDLEGDPAADAAFACWSRWQGWRLQKKLPADRTDRKAFEAWHLKYAHDYGQETLDGVFLGYLHGWGVQLNRENQSRNATCALFMAVFEHRLLEYRERAS